MLKQKRRVGDKIISEMASGDVGILLSWEAILCRIAILFIER